jgi:predicted Zn-dependent protease
MQLLFLKFGRDAERQSDELGFRYMVAKGYDPREMAEVFQTLARTSELRGGGEIPEWLSTHPDPGDREETARRRAEKVKDVAQLEVGRDPYLAQVNGMVFGDDPRQGYFKGDTFLHPGMKFQLQLPQGWNKQNTAAALLAASPEQDAALQLTTAGKAPPAEALQKFLAQEGVRPAGGEAVPATKLTASASWFEAQTEQGVVRGLVSFIAHAGSTIMIVGYAPGERVGQYQDAFREVVASFAPLTDPADLEVKPARVELVKVPREMTIEEFAREFPSTVPLEVLAVANGVEKGGTIPAGITAKRIVGGALARASMPGSGRSPVQSERASHPITGARAHHLNVPSAVRRRAHCPVQLE